MKLTTPRFAPEFEAEYRKYYLSADTLQLFLGIVLWMVAFVGFFYSDFLLYGASNALMPLLLVRLAYGACCAVFLVLLRRTSITPQRYDPIALGWGLLTVAANLGVGLLRPRDDLSVLILDLVGVFSFYVFISGSMLRRVLPALLMTFIDLVLILFYKQDIAAQVCLALTFSFTITNLVGVIFSRSFYDIRRAEFLARHEEARVQAELTRLATTDPLTGVFNRRRLLELADQAFYRHRRYERPFSIMLMDLDEFKKVNDTFGHMQGDAALVAFTRVVMDEKREGDAFGRMGGAEFALLLPEPALPAAAVLAGRILARCASLVLGEGAQQMRVATSIGISQAQADDQTLDSIFTRADQALYQAKHKGRSRFETA